MFNFSNIEPSTILNKDYILKKIDQISIFYYYHGKFDFKTIESHKFRKDKSPSAGFYINKSGKVIYNDIAGREPKMDCFDYVCRLYSCSFKDAIKRVAVDFGLINGRATDIKAVTALKESSQIDTDAKKEYKINFYADDWNENNLAFWKEYHITQEELERENIYPIKRLFVNDQEQANVNKLNRYALTTTYNDEMRTKVYVPGNKPKVTSNNIPNSFPFGTESLEKESNAVFITKSQKDRIILKKFITDVLSSQNESRSAITDNTIKKLDHNYDIKYLGFDNDEAGLNAMEQMEVYGFIPIYIPVELNEEGITDFSDLAKKRGLNAVEKLLKQTKVI